MDQIKGPLPVQPTYANPSTTYIVYQTNMYVLKRNGAQEPVRFDKITRRVEKLCHGLSSAVNPILVAQKVTAGVYDNVPTSQLDDLAAETAMSLTSTHPDYAVLAGRITVSNLHKTVPASFAEVIHALYSYVHPKTGQPAPLIADDVHKIIMDHCDRLEAEINHERDFLMFDYFGMKTLQRSYLLRLDGEVAERPQHLFMRVAVGIHKQDLESAIRTYHLMSEGWMTHASPTLFNAGTQRPQCSSCFMMTLKEDRYARAPRIPSGLLYISLPSDNALFVCLQHRGHL